MECHVDAAVAPAASHRARRNANHHPPHDPYPATAARPLGAPTPGIIPFNPANRAVVTSPGERATVRTSSSTPRHSLDRRFPPSARTGDSILDAGEAAPSELPPEHQPERGHVDVAEEDRV